VYVNDVVVDFGAVVVSNSIDVMRVGAPFDTDARMPGISTSCRYPYKRVSHVPPYVPGTYA